MFSGSPFKVIDVAGAATAICANKVETSRNKIVRKLLWTFRRFSQLGYPNISALAKRKNEREQKREEEQER